MTCPGSSTRQHQVDALAPQLSLREVGHGLGRGGPLDQSLEHGAAGHAEDVGCDARQLDVGRFQELQEPVAFGRLAFHQLAAIAQEFPQLPQRRRWHEALGDQAMPDQIGNPFGILHVGFAPGDVTDVPSVADDEFKTPFQHGIDGLPVDAGALHADMAHTQAQ